MKTPEKRLRDYEVDVEDPYVSGMEHLEMLFNRSELAKLEPELDSEQRRRLAAADQLLVAQAAQFYQAIQSIANLSSWRARKQESPDHWWWYLDVLAAAPIGPVAQEEHVLA
ncbi:MAG: hypothetical protein R3A44_13840 [Caldilineaceae bacterium]